MGPTIVSNYSDTQHSSSLFFPAFLPKHNDTTTGYCRTSEGANSSFTFHHSPSTSEGSNPTSPSNNSPVITGSHCTTSDGATPSHFGTTTADSSPKSVLANNSSSTSKGSHPQKCSSMSLPHCLPSQNTPTSCRSGHHATARLS